MFRLIVSKNYFETIPYPFLSVYLKLEQKAEDDTKREEEKKRRTVEEERASKRARPEDEISVIDHTLATPPITVNG